MKPVFYCFCKKKKRKKRETASVFSELFFFQSVSGCPRVSTRRLFFFNDGREGESEREREREREKE